ncbi:MAG TPA: hypothetical protein VIG49_10635 [Acetobacteraceae bacterium]|jgi:hypothetical protein
MSDFVVHEVAPDVRVRIERPMPPLAPELDAMVETLWRSAAERVAAGGAGHLFNGRVFSADTIAPDRITGHMTEFRRVVAQMEDPSLGADLGVRPLAVCGVLSCRDGLVVGRRPAAAVYQPGLWQLPPAGSVDQNAVRPDGSTDLAGQLLAELREELGLRADQVSAPRPLCLVEHPGSRVSDLGMTLSTSLDSAAIHATHRASGNHEYDPLRIVPFADVPAFIAAAGRQLVPPARIFLSRLRLAGPKSVLAAG